MFCVLLIVPMHLLIFKKSQIGMQAVISHFVPIFPLLGISSKIKNCFNNSWVINRNIHPGPATAEVYS